MKSLVLVVLCLLPGAFCACTDTCKCDEIDFGDISGDITDVNQTTLDNKGKPEYVYWISPCSPTACEAYGTSGDAVGCQYLVKHDAYQTLGRADTVEWVLEDPNNFTVIYGNGDTEDNPQLTRRTRVIFTVNGTTPATVSFAGNIADDTYDDYIFQVYLSKKEADRPASGAGAPIGIAGIVIMLLLILGVAAYFIVGAVVMYNVKGARGVEAIPHYQFWKGLPLLIKDGCLFTISPCRKKFGSGYEAL